MNSKEEAPLKKCSERIKKDLGPTYPSNQWLSSIDVKSHEELEPLMAIFFSLERIRNLFTIFPSRGPSASTTFRNLLSKDPHWLEKLKKELNKETETLNSNLEILKKLKENSQVIEDCEKENSLLKRKNDEVTITVESLKKLIQHRKIEIECKMFLCDITPLYKD